tara:strand:+ start:1360 stop:2121 length:762 start_codon:yes stop_codon:yes gene_type:complete
MIIYTVITKEDCPVPDQQVVDSRFKYICLHSVDVEKKYPWTYIKIKEEKNAYYTYNKYKILSPFKKSILIDGKNVLTKHLYDSYEKFLQYDIALNDEGNRFSFLDEIVDWLVMPVISYEEALNYIIDVKNMGYPFHDVPEGRGYLTSVLYRDNVDDFNRTWWTHWLKFEKRNQLSFYLASYFENKKIYLDPINFVRTPRHQPYPWTNMRLQHENIGKLKNFKHDLLKLGIEYEFKEIALHFRNIPIQLIEKIS